MVRTRRRSFTRHSNAVRRQNVASRHYDYKLIYDRLECLVDAVEDDSVLDLVSLLRSGLVRNLGNITAPRLYNRAYAGTKLLIGFKPEQYDADLPVNLTASA